MLETKVFRSVMLWVAAVAVTSFGFLAFSPRQANADQCSINGRDCYIGYFFGQYDGGPGTLRNNVISLPAMLNVNNATDLVNVTGSHMNCSGGVLLNAGSQNATGSAFIVLTMLGYPPGTSKNVACQVFSEWANVVQQWAPNTNYNTFYDFGGLNTRSSNTDVAYYPSAQTAAWSIVFYSPSTGEPLYGIKKDCANPVGRLQALPRNYTLTPRVDTVSPTQIEAGSKMTVTTSVDAEGDVDSQPTQWEITQINVQPGQPVPNSSGGISGEAPCQSSGGAPSGNYFRNGVATCKNAAKGSGVFTLGSPSGSLQPELNGYDIGDVPVGTKVCFALSVQPRANSDSRWAHSAPVCTTVGKKPKIQVWGGDVSVRGRIETSTSVKDIGGNKTFGSWVEYGAFAVGAIDRFASGSGLNGQPNNSQEVWSKLTFANVDNSTNPSFGQFTTAAGFRPQPAVAAYFGAIANKQPIGPGSVDVSTLTFATGGPITVRTANDLTITASNIPPGRSAVIIATGTVTIAGNITYSDAALNSVNAIPQVVIIAANINIQDNVGRVDSWLVTDGTINTCSNFSGNLTSNKCGGLLEVNGPVITNKLLLNRTAGS
ncbi:MAG TPA: hypothetical protein VFO38_02585, partial [Candidatus Saccharimonadales bacterium]|nr:hypothetical protein [Candidatus Saccharimonadales bacterium]